MLATARNRPAITGTPCVILVAPLAAWAGGRGQLWIRIHINGFANVLGDPWSVLAGGRLSALYISAGAGSQPYV